MPDPSDSLFAPQHLAVVGASERAGSLGERVLTALLRAPFGGCITPVNLRHKTVAGIKAYANLGRMPDAADAALVLTPPHSYEAVLKACHKQGIPHALLVQDWDAAPAETLAQAQEALHKARRLNVQASVCHAAALQVPALGLNTGTHPPMPPGNIGIVSGHAAESARLAAQLRQAGLGVSRHIGLHYALVPQNSAAFITLLGNDPETGLIVATHNPLENQRRLFSALRLAARRKPVVLSVCHHADEEEQAVLLALARRCGFLPAFTPDETAAAVHALAAAHHGARKLHIIANEPCGRLKTQAESQGIALGALPDDGRPSENTCGYIGSNPAPLRFRALAESCLQHGQTEALLAVVAPTADGSAADTTRLLANLQRQSAKPLLVSSPFSDGLLQFGQTAQALQAFRCQTLFAELKQQQAQTAKPLPAHLKSPSAREIQKTLDNPLQLAKTLCLPEPKAPDPHPFAELVFRRHPRYGALLLARTPRITLALLPPFTTADAEHLIRRTDLKRHQKTLHQLLHSLNTVAAAPALTGIAAVTVSVGSGGSSSNIVLTPRPEPAENVLAPRPAAAHTFALRNGQTVRIRPLLPEDAEAKQNFVRSLPEPDRYARYMMHLAELSPAMLARACNLDYAVESAVVAETENGVWLGVARFGGTDTPGRCEFGISVAPAAQGQGLAAHLMKHIIQTAKQQGYREMYAEILPSNPAMQKLSAKLGFALHPSPHDNRLTQAVLDLSPPPGTPAGNIRHNLKQQILALKS